MGYFGSAARYSLWFSLTKLAMDKASLLSLDLAISLLNFPAPWINKKCCLESQLAITCDILSNKIIPHYISMTLTLIMC